MTNEIKITHIVPDARDLNTYVELAEKHALCFEYDDFFEPDLLDDREALDRRIALYRDLGRPKGRDTMHGAFYDIIPFSWDSGICRHSLYRMQQSVEIAGRLGCKGVVFHTGLTPGLVGSRKYRDNWVKVMADTMRTLLAQDESLEIYCENMFDESPDELADLAAALRDEERFGICLDIAHMMLVTDEPEQWFEKLGSHIHHFHINDNHLNRDEHLALGDGVIDWPRMYELMGRHDLMQRSILLEVTGADKIRASLDYIRKGNG
ncbi:MAG: sugar phosphate isomerase/epimerase [Clostridium sp.]|nr:sugar phosphate isomerase/epimerase [Acetatifactor muris]MCM1527090.1 sugar phosphate isomerase/epimerase [Bacteroides sp.]MCM1563405.1 sugar phosphate isomerase/epimerase [Clostridium sp.]